MSKTDLCTCKHIEECHGKSKAMVCMGPTGYAFGAISYGCSCKGFELDGNNPKNIQYWDYSYPEGWRKIVYKLNADKSLAGYVITVHLTIMMIKVIKYTT